MIRNPESEKKLSRIRRVAIVASVGAIAGIAAGSALRDSEELNCGNMRLFSTPEATIVFDKKTNILIDIETSGISVDFERNKQICGGGSISGGGRFLGSFTSGLIIENSTVIVFADPKQKSLANMELEYPDHTESIPAINDGLLVVGIVKEGELPETIDLIAKDGTVFDDVAHPRANIEEAEKHVKDAVTENPEGHGQ